MTITTMNSLTDYSSGQTTPEQREAWLDAFEQSEMNGTDFMNLYEVKIRLLKPGAQNYLNARGEIPNALRMHLLKY